MNVIFSYFRKYVQKPFLEIFSRIRSPLISCTIFPDHLEKANDYEKLGKSSVRNLFFYHCQSRLNLPTFYSCDKDFNLIFKGELSLEILVSMDWAYHEWHLLLSQFQHYKIGIAQHQANCLHQAISGRCRRRGHLRQIEGRGGCLKKRIITLHLTLLSSGQ